MIRWGTWVDSLATLEGYQLTATGTVARYRQSTRTGEISVIDTLSATIPQKTHCDVAFSLQNAFIRNQTYVVIGPVSQYVEYTTPQATLRAVWDTRFQTYGSREFRAIFRWLNSLIGVHSDAHPDR